MSAIINARRSEKPLPDPAGISLPRLDEIKLWEGADSFRVVLYPSAAAEFKYDLLAGKPGDSDRVYIDLKVAEPARLRLPEIRDNSFLKTIRIAKRGEGIRIVFASEKVEKYNVSVLEEPWRIVIDYFGVKKNAAKTQPGENTAAKTPDKKKSSPVPPPVFVIVLDPGHGGKDPGAVYKKTRVYEKDIVTKLADIIRKKAKKKKGIKVVLTRQEDIYLPLEERAAIANKYEGNLFISLHVNSCDNSDAEGVEIYYLDNRRDSYTDKLAMVENKLTNESSLLNTILVDMTMSLYIDDSILFAEAIGQRLEKRLPGFDTTLRSYRKGALFYVLVGARMPSLLIEVGFLSNKKDRKLLQNSKYLDMIAEEILEAVDQVQKTNDLVKK